MLETSNTSILFIMTSLPHDLPASKFAPNYWVLKDTELGVLGYL